MLLALGCGPDDRALYLQATTSTPAEALPLCGRIGDVGLSGQCTVEAVQALAPVDLGRAEDGCRALPDGLWREECWFLLADTLELAGEQAEPLCSQAGRFAKECQAHAAGRALLALPGLPREVGREWELEIALLREAQARLDDPQQAGRIARAAAARIIAERLQARPLSDEVCGRAPRDLCVAAWAHTLRERADLETLCAGPVGPAEAAAAGAVGWTPEWDADARGAWPGLCEGWAGGTSPTGS